MLHWSGKCQRKGTEFQKPLAVVTNCLRRHTYLYVIAMFEQQTKLNVRTVVYSLIFTAMHQLVCTGSLNMIL